jgi:chemotaxis protein MotB
MSEEATQRPIIVIKKKGGHGGHHGGAWKVAYADFVTAMMSLFIVLWLLNSTPQVKKAIAGYFNDPKGTSKQMGTDMLGDGPSVSIDKTNVEKLKESIQKAIVQQKELEKLANQIEMKVTSEGLRIELIEGKNGTFFQSGGTQMSASGEQLVNLLAGQLKTLPNNLLIEGHTDAKAYGSGNAGYSNWELSSDRANAARRLLQQDGVRQNQVAQVRGFADQSLRVPNDPLDPSNRRISLIVQFMQAPAGTKGEEMLDRSEDKEGEKKEGTEKAAATEKGPSRPPEAQPVTGTIDLPAKPGAATSAKQVEAVPSTGKIDLPAKPSAGTPLPRPPTKLGDQINFLNQMKQSDAGHGKGK